MSDTELKLRSFLESETMKLGTRESLPTADELFRYFEGRLDDSTEKRMLNFIRESKDHQDFIMAARSVYEAAQSAGEDEVRLPVSLIRDTQRALVKDSGVRSGFLRDWIWLILAFAAFALSFVIKRYFLQCLVVALFCGIKWILDRKSRATRMLIYQNLPKEPQQGDRHSRLQDDEHKL